MSTRLLRSAFIAVVAVAVLPAVGQAKSAPVGVVIDHPCHSPGRVVVANKRAAVTLVKFRAHGYLPGLWGCAAGHRARYLDDSSGAIEPALSGSVAATALRICGAGGCATQVTRRNLSTGAAVKAQSSPTQAFDDQGPVAVFVTTSRVVVFSTHPDNTLQPPPLGPSQIISLDANGSRVLLDAGVGVDATSLAVGGPNAYWMTDGTPRHAGLG